MAVVHFVGQLDGSFVVYRQPFDSSTPMLRQLSQEGVSTYIAAPTGHFTTSDFKRQQSVLAELCSDNG